MPRLRLICPGATAAGVASTLLIAGGAKFTAAPLGGGRWLIEAETNEPTASLVAMRVGDPIVLGNDTPVSATEPPPSAAVGGAPPPPPDVVDRTGFTARSIPSAKAAAIRAAKGFGAIPYSGEPWSFDGDRFSRPAYRGKRAGAIVFGAATGCDWWVGWTPAT